VRDRLKKEMKKLDNSAVNSLKRPSKTKNAKTSKQPRAQKSIRRGKEALDTTNAKLVQSVDKVIEEQRISRKTNKSKQNHKNEERTVSKSLKVRHTKPVPKHPHLTARTVVNRDKKKAIKPRKCLDELMNIQKRQKERLLLVDYTQSEKGDWMLKLCHRQGR